ncbi:FAD-dependent oxidoreductase [Amycolatopsis sp. NPDC051373]|uniref:FAD-binding oxidoreductase n=1 Tax=Amycolatopsis sp. NPDC051373 TaxID=3155801 RepID=UPI00344EA03E
MKITVPPALADRVVRPGSPEYRLLRSTYTRVHSPAAVILPRSPEEVRAALEMVHDTGLPLAVRSGGHSMSGRSSNDGGIVIDLSGLHRVDVVDRGRRLVRIEAGARWGRVARTLAEHGLALSSGDHGNVGVGGLATAGGIGWLVRKYGLTIDRLRAAEVVLADGTITTVDADRDPELFWGLRGGGGTLAIVTAFVFEAVKITRVAVAQLQVEVSNARSSLVAWDEYLRTAPRELTATMTLFGGRKGTATAQLTAVYAGDDPSTASRVFRPLGDLGPVRDSAAQLMPYRALVPVAHEHPNVGQQDSFVRNGFVDKLDDEVQRRVFGLTGAPEVLVQIRALGGAIGDVDEDATAFAHRHQSAMIVGTVWGAGNIVTLDESITPLARHFTGAYVNFDADGDRAIADLAFPLPTRQRLARLKHRVDPNGLFPAYSV